VKNLNLVFIYLPNILVTIELYGLRMSITIKEHEKDRSTPNIFIEIAPLVMMPLQVTCRKPNLANPSAYAL
jgi:hypothetical protein